jgi:hypothetical protein
MQISTVLKSLGISQYTLVGNPTTESEFRNKFRKIGSMDADGMPIYTDNWGFTWDELQSEYARLQAEEDATRYQRDRAPEYPPIGDQLDALWKGGDAATEMLAKVQAVKDKYPKPE